MCVLVRCLGISSSCKFSHLCKTWYCTFLIKESCHVSTSDGLWCKVSQLFKLPVALLKTMRYWDTHPLPHGWLFPAQRKDGQWETNCDYIYWSLSSNPHALGAASPNYSQLWILEVSLIYYIVLLCLLQNAEYWHLVDFFCPPQFQLSAIICQMLPTQLLFKWPF